MIKITDLKKEYRIDDKSFLALDGINIEFPSVQFVSILGPSGCGKTTLLNCIGGLDTFNSGDITIDSISLKEISEKEKDSYRNNYIGFVFQNYYLIPQLTLLDNIKIALSVRDYSKEEIETKAIEAIDAVGMIKYKNKRPNQISGGQAQRIAIARAIVNDPKVIIADEPTGALDSLTSDSIMALLKSLSKDRLVIMVTHNEDLADKYSDRIIRLKDGKIIDDSASKSKIEAQSFIKELKKSKLSFKMRLKLALKNILSRKTKTILTAIANSFGMIGIGFFLAINLGFSNYSNNLSTASATSLPVVVSAFNRETSSENFSEVNASEEYPNADEIYPSISVSSQYSYTYNNFTSKYLSYLDSLIDEGIVREYIMSYGNDYSFNLATSFPDSLDNEDEGGYDLVETSVTSYNYYAYQASLPYNIFHVLYGDLDQYDLIEGNLPTDDNELVLVVNKYNAVSFNILRNLGFYNMNDKEEDVKDSDSKTKVKPIKFSDVIGKTYKVFSDDELYYESEIKIREDGLGYTKEIPTYTQNELTDTFYSSFGKELKITGIIRPKKTSPLTILAPALCYLPSLQNTLVNQNKTSSIANTIRNNLVFDKKNSYLDFYSEINKVIQDYRNSKSSILPTSEMNTIFNKYFYYIPYEDVTYYYTGYSTFLSDAKKHGAKLIDDELLGKDLSDENILNQQLTKMYDAYIDGDYKSLYDTLISMLAYANAYSSITALVIFPVDLPSRSALLEKLDEFNTIDGNSNHAMVEEERVSYVSENANSMLEEVGQMISLTSMILIIFAIISLIVSSSMTALLTSNNVLERKKEIGLLRSLGSRKKDVALLFLSETLIVGILSGLLGSLMTYILSIPINWMINYYYSYYNVGTICCFTWYHVFIILGIAILISVIASLIPSIKASKENPVDALRSE